MPRAACLTLGVGQIMKRDFTLIREILKDMESAGPLQQFEGFHYEGRTDAEVNEHIELLLEAGLLKGEVKRMRDRAIVLVSRLTWNGHDFLDAMKDESLWQKAQASILKPIGGVAFDVLLEWLKWQAKKRLGMPESD